MRPLLILGSGTFAVETLDIAEAAGGFRPLGFVNSLERPQPSTMVEGLPVFWIDDLPYMPDDCFLVAGMVSTKRRAFVETMRGRGYQFVTVVHPSAVISRRSTIGTGCVVNAAAVIASNTHIDDHVILNRGCLIGHDNHIGQFTTVGPGANLAGGLVIGAGAYVGVGAVIRDHLRIGVGSVVGAGAVVVKSIPERVLVAGVPARIMQTEVEGL